MSQFQNRQQNTGFMQQNQQPVQNTSFSNQGLAAGYQTQQGQSFGTSAQRNSQGQPVPQQPYGSTFNQNQYQNPGVQGVLSPYAPVPQGANLGVAPSTGAYGPVQGTLLVRPQAAKFLKNHELIGKMDPYAVIFLGEQKFQTQVAKAGGLEPIWHDILQLPINGQQEIKL